MNRKLFHIPVAILIALCLTVGQVAGQGSRSGENTPSQGVVSIDAIVNSRISYQGVLREDEQPVTGTRNMIFDFYANNNCTGAAGLSVTKNNVQVTDGLFSVSLDVTHSLFNGTGLWLRVRVDGAVLSCEEVLAVPYALSLRPGADSIATLANDSIFYAWNTATSGSSYGVSATSSSSSGRAIYGNASAGSGITYGGYFETGSSSGRGVYGYASSTTGNTNGVRGRSTAPEGAGVYGYAHSNSGGRVGVFGDVNGTGYGLSTYDHLYVGGSCTGCTMVFIARNADQDTLRLGDIVAISGVGPMLQGHTTPVLEVRRATASDLHVLGVVFSRGEFYAAADGQPGNGDSIQPVGGDAAAGDYLLVVTEGLAQVRVASTSTYLKPGQRLAVGSQVGVAAPVSVSTEPSLIFAYAAESQPDENDLLWAMVGSR